MAEKVQKPLISAVFTVSIIILIIFFAFMWGRVILIKNVDTNKVNTMVSNLELLDQAVRECAETRRTQTVEVDLTDIAIYFSHDELTGRNAINMETITLTPILSFVTWVPINSKSLPYVTERYIQYLRPSTQSVACFHGLSGPVKYNTLNMYGVDYTFFAKILGEEECPIFVCLREEGRNLDCREHCGCETDVLSLPRENFIVSFANEEVVEFGGRVREREGIVGMDISGVILGRAERHGTENLNTMKLVYRTMVDGDRKERIVLNYSGEVEEYGGTRKVQISFASVVQEGDVTVYNLIISILR